MKISIEYCTASNYLPRAASVATEILNKYGNTINSLTLIPSGGGVFEVIKNDKLIFSKKESGRFPELNELFKAL